MKLLRNLALSFATLFSAAILAAINVNTASVAELQKLNGIGVKKAEAIVAYRTEHGAFTKAEDLLNVKGIGEGILEKIRADIEFGVSGESSTKTAEEKPASTVVEQSVTAEQAKKE